MKYIFEKIKTLAIFAMLYLMVMAWGFGSMGFFSRLDTFPQYHLYPDIAYLEPLFLLALATLVPLIIAAYRYKSDFNRLAGYLLVAGTLLSYPLLPFIMVTDARHIGWRPPVYTTNYNAFVTATLHALDEARIRQDAKVPPQPPPAPAPVAPDSPAVPQEVPTDPAPVPVVADESSTSEPPPVSLPKKSSQPARAPSAEKKSVVEQAAAVKQDAASQKTIDERYTEIGNQRCGTPDGIIEKAAWIVCTQPLRFELCKGIWSENPPPGQKTCRGSSNGN